MKSSDEKLPKTDEQKSSTEKPKKSRDKSQEGTKSSSSTAKDSQTLDSTRVLRKKIEQSILQLKSKEDGKRLVTRIQEKCADDEHAHAMKLFESYEAIVSTHMQEVRKKKKASKAGEQVVIDFQDSSSDDQGTDLDDVHFMQEVPLYLYQGTARQIAGWDALSRNIFWVRVAMIVCSLLSFAVMKSLPYINQGMVSSVTLLSSYCSQHSQYGEFSYSSYLFAARMGIFAWIYSIVFVTYYLIPADSQERKYIPAAPLYFPVRWGKRVLFERKSSTRYLEVFFDALLFVFCLSAAIASSVNIERAVIFHSQWSTQCVYGKCAIGGCMDEAYACEGCDNLVCSDGTCPNPDGWCEHDCDNAVRCLDGSCPTAEGGCDYGPDAVIYSKDGPDDVFYSLKTFVDTYDHMSASCLDHDPVVRIRVAVAFLFLTVFLLLIALQISLRSLYLEKMQRDVIAGKKSLPLSNDSTHSGE